MLALDFDRCVVWGGWYGVGGLAWVVWGGGLLWVVWGGWSGVVWDGWFRVVSQRSGVFGGRRMAKGGRVKRLVLVVSWLRSAQEKKKEKRRDGEEGWVGGNLGGVGKRWVV